jgi:hypothetical protein
MMMTYGVDLFVFVTYLLAYKILSVRFGKSYHLTKHIIAANDISFKSLKARFRPWPLFCKY